MNAQSHYSGEIQGLSSSNNKIIRDSGFGITKKWWEVILNFEYLYTNPENPIIIRQEEVGDGPSYLQGKGSIFFLKNLRPFMLLQVQPLTHWQLLTGIT